MLRKRARKRWILRNAIYALFNWDKYMPLLSEVMGEGQEKTWGARGVPDAQIALLFILNISIFIWHCPTVPYKHFKHVLHACSGLGGITKK